MMGAAPYIPKIKTTFKAILDEQDKHSLFERAAAVNNEILVKIEGSPGIEATLYNAKKWNGTHLFVEYVSGPLLVTAPVIVAAEIGKIWFCFTATIFLSDENPRLPGAIDFDQAYEVQRREAHRVTIPQGILKAQFVIPTLKKAFRIIDLSEGGAGLFVPQEDISLFPEKAILPGNIEIQGYDPLEGLNAENMHNDPEEGGMKAGCRFVKTSLAIRQRISFLVNACHRDVFGKVKKR
jgi:hypothetical protein